MIVRILGTDLPGARFGDVTAVRVGLQVRQDVVGDVAGDAPEARFEAEVVVGDKDGVPTFRGPAVHGKAPERFLYLSWGGVQHGHAVRFRRAKLRLDLVPADVLTKAVASGVLIGRVSLTMKDGSPLCASVRPPVIAWRAG